MIAPRMRIGWRKPAKPQLGSSSIGLTDLADEERDAARMPLLALFGISWFSKRIYLDSFYTTIDAEYSAFASLRVPRDAKIAIAPRVAAAIRTIAAFSSWYPVIWRFVARGFAAAVIVSIAAAACLAFLVLRVNWDPIAALVALVAGGAVIAISARLLLRLPRRWPFDVLLVVSTGAVFGTAAELIYGQGDRSAVSVAFLVAATAVGSLCVVTTLVLTVAQGASQLVTWAKISNFPEEEIIQTTAFMLGRWERVGEGWRKPEERAKAAENLEWIARRFERNMSVRYGTGDASVDEKIGDLGTRIAAAFRARRKDVVFPGASTPAMFATFLWNTLQMEAQGRWGELERAEPVAADVSRASRFVANAQRVLAVVLPAAIAVTVKQLNLLGHDSALQWNVVVTGCTWSVLALLAAANPRQFEQQASTAKTLGELLKKA